MDLILRTIENGAIIFTRLQLLNLDLYIIIILEIVNILFISKNSNIRYLIKNTREFNYLMIIYIAIYDYYQLSTIFR